VAANPLIGSTIGKRRRRRRRRRRKTWYPYVIGCMRRHFPVPFGAISEFPSMVFHMLFEIQFAAVLTIATTWKRLRVRRYCFKMICG